MTIDFAFAIYRF